MIVAELIETLRKLPLDLPVVVNDGVCSHGVACEVEIVVADQQDYVCFGSDPLRPGDAYVMIT